LLDELPGFVMG